MSADKKNVAGIHHLNGATNTQQYVAVGQAMTWPDAKAYCESQYHSLAAIHDEASNEYVKQLCWQQLQATGGASWGQADRRQAGSMGSCWIGANDLETEGVLSLRLLLCLSANSNRLAWTGTFVWSDGTELDYTNWYPGQPNNVPSVNANNVQGDEDAVELRIVCDPTWQCCPTRTCPLWCVRPFVLHTQLALAKGWVLCRVDNRGDRGSGRVYPFICEEHNRAQGGGGH